MKNNLRDASAGSSHFPLPSSNHSVHSPLRYTRRHPPSELSLIEVLAPVCTSYTHTHTGTHACFLIISPHFLLTAVPSLVCSQSLILLPGFSLLSPIYLKSFSICSASEPLYAHSTWKTLLFWAPPPCVSVCELLCLGSVLHRVSLDFHFFSKCNYSALKHRKPVVFPKLISDSYYQFSMTVCLGAAQGSQPDRSDDGVEREREEKKHAVRQTQCEMRSKMEVILVQIGDVSWSGSTAPSCKLFKEEHCVSTLTETFCRC